MVSVVIMTTGYKHFMAWGTVLWTFLISRRTCELRVFAAAWRTSGLMTSVDWKNK